MNNNQAEREELANLQHQQWSGWMEYLFSKCQQRGAEGTVLPLPNDEDVVIPAAYAHNLVKLMQTPYLDLTEKEKESDRIEADKYLPIIAKAQKEYAVEVWEKLKEKQLVVCEPTIKPTPNFHAVKVVDIDLLINQIKQEI